LSQITNTNFSLAGVSAPSNCGAANFPIVLANVVNASNQSPIFNPYSILPKVFNATKPDGTTLNVTVKVGIIGLHHHRSSIGIKKVWLVK